MTSRVLTPANQITILRLVFVPIFAMLVIDRTYTWALGVLVAAAVSDVVDGNVARIFHQESPLGVALDPIADKVLMTTAYLTLAFRDALPWWLTIMVLSRDVAILLTALLIILVAGYRSFRPTALGKASTAMQVMMIFLAVGHQAGIAIISLLVVQAGAYLTMALTVASGLHYLVIVRHRYSHPDE
ncbi:MAG: CDP-alcohol phosphatidyltransferase family protein [Terriglobia bacterium]|jgi:cardiolipin synthase